jgi:heat shock protein HslJ
MTAAIRIVLAAAAALGAAACGDSPNGPSPAIRGTWRLVSLQRASNPPVPVEDPGRYTVTFEADGSAGIRSDCNSCGGAYDLSGTTLVVRGVVCTEVACAAPTLDPEFVAALEAAHTVSVEQGEAVIVGRGWTLRLVQ